MKTETKHTPGPWKASNWASGWEVGAPDSHYTVCRLGGCNNADANARIIAEVPKLLDAAKEALDQLERCLQGADLEAQGDDREAGVTEYQNLRAAIAAAEGGRE